ncbi:MAG: fused MFS/spermidine synthase [Hyphomicrobiales bacterium]
MPPTPSPGTHRGLLYGCFFASGIAGLALEIVWSKYLSYLLGNSIYGVSTVVAAFLGGLGLGAAWGGRLAPRVRNPLVFYARLEIVVGALGLLSPLGYQVAGPLFAWLHEALGGGGPLFLTVRFAVLFAALLAPTTAMGATLPLLVEHADRIDASEGRRLGSAAPVARLYAINTAGAVLGVLAAGFFLIPVAGLWKTAALAAAIDFSVAGAIAAARPRAFPAPEGAPAAEPATSARATPPSALFDRLILPLFAVSGLTAILYQVAWTRILAVPFGGMVYAFSAILALYLLGLAVGAAGAVRALKRSASPAGLFGILQVGLAATVALGTHFFAQIPHRQEAAIAASNGNMLRLLWGETLITALVVLPPTLFLGALFPAAVAIHRRRRGETGAATGSVYAANTLGSIAGSLFTAFVFIPTFGALKTILGGAATNLAIGFLALAAGSGATRWRRAVAGASVAGGLAFALFWTPGWNAERMSFGLIRLLRSHWYGGVSLTNRIINVIGTSPQYERLLYYKEGNVANVTVVETQGQRALLINGKTDATTGRGADMRTQVLVGQLPLLAQPATRDVCIIGYGSGVTTHSVLTHPIRKALTVELEAAVIGAAPLFRDDAQDPLDDPRSRLVIEDAQTLLRADRRKYDVIISEPSNLWIAGSGDLFTREFYRVAASRLNPGGIFCQWVQCYQISPEATNTVFRTLTTRFRHGQVFFVDSAADMIIIASPDGEVPIDAAVWRRTMSDSSVAADFARVGIGSLADLLRYYRGRLDHLAERAGTGPINTNDNGWLEHRAPFDLIESEGANRTFDWTPTVAGDLVESLRGDPATLRSLLGTAAARADSASFPEAGRGLRMALERLTTGAGAAGP